MHEKATEYLTLTNAEKMINQVSKVQSTREEPIHPAFLVQQLKETGYINFAITRESPNRYYDIECIQVGGKIKVVYDVEYLE